MRQNSYDPFGAELRRFAETLDRRNFKALSPGLGVAHVTKKSVPMQAFAPPRTYTPTPIPTYPQAKPIAAKPIFRKPEARPVIAPVILDQPVSIAHEKTATPIPSSSFLQRLVVGIVRTATAHLIDVSAVFVSFVAALFIAAYAFAPRAPHSPHSHTLIDALAAWAPVKLILGMGVLYFFVLIYALFAVYWVFLKLAVGATLGHTLTAFATRPEIQKTE